MKRIFNILIISLLLVSCAVKQPKSNYNQKELEEIDLIKIDE